MAKMKPPAVPDQPIAVLSEDQVRRLLDWMPATQG
jgi:hypothetical protein